MFDMMAQHLANAGALGYPLLLLALASPLLCPGLYLFGVLLKNKAWALRFGLLNATLGVALPLISWAIASARMTSTLAEIKSQVSPADLETITFAARSEMLALPWLALLSSPWLVGSGFALLGVALLGHPALAPAPAVPTQPLAAPPAQ